MLIRYMNEAKPFIKWVGGKRSILPELLKRMPDAYDTYHEPFIGGGALFFASQPQRAIISDVNSDLITTYKAVRDNVDQLIEYIFEHSKNHDKTYFCKAREELFIEKDPIKIAALFIYLNKTCFNGLYRVNKSGKFNSAYGGEYQWGKILEEDVLRNASKVLQNIDIRHQQFFDVSISRGDFYYFDPPYHGTYNGYNSEKFTDDDHEKLANICHDIDRVGGFFMLSNSNTDFVRALYRDYKIEEVIAARVLNTKVESCKAKEFLIRNY